MTIQGVGEVTALTWALEIGDPLRFASIRQAIVQLGHTLGMRIIAEGVETREHLCRLQEMGCDLYQGYHFATPLSADTALEFIREHAHPGWQP